MQNWLLRRHLSQILFEVVDLDEVILDFEQLLDIFRLLL